MAMGGEPLAAALREKPSSAYLRRLWFFCELLTGEKLALDDAESGAYVNALDPDQYITRSGPKLRRYRVNFNLLGNAGFCPIVRRTEKLKHYEAARLDELARGAVTNLSPRDLQRAIRCLYVKETRANFELERTTPSDRMERFVEALFSVGVQVPGPVWWNERDLVEIAGLIINDARFAPTGYRKSEVRVSEQRSLSARERVHFVGARHQDVPELMQSLLAAWEAHHFSELPSPMLGSIAGLEGQGAHGFRFSCGLPFVDFVLAGCISFGFVYIHPFEDGNGRLHRLMLHRILSVTHFTPSGLLIPTSAAILHDLAGYDLALEDFSKRVMPLVEYSIAEADGSLVVHNDTADLYRYPDLTVQIEALCGWFESAVRTELVEELHTLRAIDDAKVAMREVVELPDQRENLFLRLCMQSFADGRGYTLSKAKRTSLFNELSDTEVAALEEVIRSAFVPA